MVKYTHLKINQDVAAPAGHYTPEKESKININGREILYILNNAVVDSSCCGNADFAAALVPGYIINQYIANDKGAPLTAEAFRTALFWFPWILAIADCLFAYSTLISWSYYGE